jgi:hypothetical protein
MSALTCINARFEVFRRAMEMAQFFHRGLDLSRKLLPFLWVERNFPDGPRDLHVGTIQPGTQATAELLGTV